MKWMLVVVVFGSAPVPTNLVFPTLAECLRAEDEMRQAYAEAFNTWLSWARANPSRAGYPGSQSFMQRRLGLENQGTCIPYAPPG